VLIALGNLGCLYHSGNVWVVLYLRLLGQFLFKIE